MGPALRPTPLSPACGSRRGHLTPGVFNAASTSPEGPSRSAASLSPGARAGAGSVGGWGMIARTCPLPPGGSATGLSKSLPRAAWHCPKTLPHLSMDFESPALSTLRPRGFNGLGIWLAPGRTFEHSASHPSTARHLAVASIRFQNPFSVAGLSTFASEGPIPVSMNG